ncbi:methyltransferase domain-containing protein [Helicobacter sp. 11S03491-1]|uniref:methyltransferase domain-containing protein n=1 Tax=Helicobacter sp. 11S03491-1 TaxID=1476196 RepID=UPI000BA5E53B|nr:methyltransferase domain-containing protein [Helicobacter sp. 11S03491-1]PAF42681.1 hypothetical protein BKH45_04005 [Helicobacter sp. 11S03491-1]
MQTIKNNQNSFARQAHVYQKSALIQTRIAHLLLNKLQYKYFYHVLDIGCGSGSVAIEIEKLKIKVKNFIGIDIAKEMLFYHPKQLNHIQNINLICEDFEKISLPKSDLIIAASSLQWAKNLEYILSKIAQNCSEVAFGIYTNKSLKSVHNFLNTSSPLRSKEALKDMLGKYFRGKSYIAHFEESFQNRQDFLRHLKNSGLLGGGNLSYQEAKYFRNHIPYEKAEYEVLIFIGTPKQITS